MGKINRKYQEINQKTKTIIKLMKSNPTLNSIHRDYQISAKNIEDKTKEMKYVNHKVLSLNAEIEKLLEEIRVIDENRDLNTIDSVKNVNIDRKLNIAGKL